MHSAAIISALALAGSVVAAPAPAALRRDDPVNFDTPMCYWESASSLYVEWVITIPQYLNKNVQDMVGDFKGSIDKSSACRGITRAPVKGSKEWYAVGATNSTVLFSFNTSDFMTKVIKATTGNVQSTACNKFGPGEGGDPDPSNLIADIPEDGDDGEDGNFKRDATAPLTDAEMAKELGLPPNTPHADLVAKLQGPSKLD